MPLIKFTAFAGVSLLALLAVATHVIDPAPTAAPSASTSLDVLRKMANHGDVRGFAPLANAGPFLPMPVVTASTVAATEPAVIDKPMSPPPAALNAQAQMAAAEVNEKPVKAEKKIAPRKPKPRVVYVENTPRGPTGGLFGMFNTW